MIANRVYNTQDLVLQVRKSFDPAKLRLVDWERFIHMLCADRSYQKEAIKTAVNYLASGNYKSVEELVHENTRTNPNLLSRYHTLEDYKRKIQLPQKLSATIDLATGTGKSYVMYGIAQIALGLGLVDKVLVLCPSVTIKDELTRKFSELSADKMLVNSIPVNAKWRNPSIINANQTINYRRLIAGIYRVYVSYTQITGIDSLICIDNTRVAPFSINGD